MDLRVNGSSFFVQRLPNRVREFIKESHRYLVAKKLNRYAKRYLFSFLDGTILPRIKKNLSLKPRPICATFAVIC